MNKTIKLFLICIICLQIKVVGKDIIWQIGENDNSALEFALAPDQYKRFLEKDFGYEDRYFLVGKSELQRDFPYILPGPEDAWGGTWEYSGWRTHEVNILFGLDNLPENKILQLIVDLVDSHPDGSLIKITVNNKSEKFRIKGKDVQSATGNINNVAEQLLAINLNFSDLKKGGNAVTIAILEGSWIVFDQISLRGAENIVVHKPEKIFVRSVAAANYELQINKRIQPLLVDIEHLEGSPLLTVKLDGQLVFEVKPDTARYIYEVPMPAVSKRTNSQYEVYVDGVLEERGDIVRDKQSLQTLANYVDTKMGTAHSRWMIAPGPWMPFSMVKISPDNQNTGWQAGYQPTFESIGCFSHIHEWTMSGLGVMPVTGTLKIEVGDEKDDSGIGYRSAIDKRTEEAPLGRYKVHLTDYDIWAELTATTRCSFQKYTYGKDNDGRIMIDLHVNSEYNYNLLDVEINQVTPYRIEGKSHQWTQYVWSGDIGQEYTVHFVMEFDKPIKHIGGWKNDEVVSNTNQIIGKDLIDAGMYVEFDTSIDKEVQVRTGISLVSIENAALNLKIEITQPFGWDFEAVVDNQLNVWESYFDRLVVSTNNFLEKKRFYSNMYRAICSRNTWSDVNGEWIAPDESKQRLENPDYLALGGDAFWNSFWNLNQFWNLVTPEWSSKWVNSQLAMYDVCGWLAKGPAGMKYIPVMVAEHEIPLIVGAYQMGIRDYDEEIAFEAVKKMQTVQGTNVGKGYAGNRDLTAYLKYKYVPTDKGRFSNSLEYSYDDWVVGQFAKALGKTSDYNCFNDRGYWWKNVIEPKSGYAQMKDSWGVLEKDFDPFFSGKDEHYVEGNAWQLTYFVPQDVPALIQVIGKERFLSRLEWGFGVSEPWRYNAPNDQYWDYPVVQGNQQSMHFAFLFNWAEKPWLTQKWSRSIINKYYGYGVVNAYLGDEDQGQMSAWFIMAAIGLFQTDGGCKVNPEYEIGSPIFEKIEIDLKGQYGRGDQFTIEAKNTSRKNIYVQKATLNGKDWSSFKFPATELLKGGSLILEMGDKPNVNWGVGR